MSDFNTDKQSEIPNTSDLSSMSNILDVIDAAFQIPDEPLTPFPAPLILIGGDQHTGLSADEIAANVISRQSEAGILPGDVYADGKNSMELLIRIIVQEIVNALMLKAKVEVVIPPGVSSTSIGIGNLGAPVVSRGETTDIGSGYGIIR